MKEDLNIVILTTDWCPHCRKMERVLDNLGLKYKNYDIYKNSEITNKYPLLKLPTTYFLKGEEVVFLIKGTKEEEEVKSLIDKYFV